MVAARKLAGVPSWPIDFQNVNLLERSHGIYLGTMPPATDPDGSGIEYSLADDFDGKVRSC